MGRVKRWIAGLKKGTFRSYLYNTFGKDAFTKVGTIRVKVINGIIEAYEKGKKFMGVRPSLRTYRRAIAARNLRVIRRKK